MSTVSAVRCESYDEQAVYNAVEDTFKKLGGVERFVSKGDSIFLKINLVMRKHPDAAATTHPMVVEAVAKKLIEAGARVIIGDSPGGPYSKVLLQGLYKACGIEEAARKSGAELNYDCSVAEYHHPEAVSTKVLTLIKPMMDCDKTITISKLKTHGMAKYTGAVKVMFGAIPGVLKAEYHYKMPDIKDFTNMLVDICTYTKPVLSIIDGIVGMEGEGPTSGTPVKSNIILASENPYDLDVVGAYSIGIKPHDVPTVKRCMERGLSTGKIDDISITGEEIGSFRKSYDVPDVVTINFGGKVPKFVEKFLSKNLLPRPVFSPEVCIGCSNCKQNCPPGAITMVSGKPQVDINKCIRCFCCQELCPQKAVQIKRSWLSKKILG